MPPLENTNALPTAAPAQPWSAGKDKDASPADPQSKKDVARKVTFLSEDSSSNNYHESERREWNRQQDNDDDDDDDVSTLTDVFHGYDIEAAKRRQEPEEEEEEEELLHLTLDPLNDDTSFDKMLEEGYIPSDDCLSPFGERGLVPAYHQGCEDVVLQIGEIVDTVKNCGPSICVRPKNSSNISNKAPREQASMFASLWEQARRFLDPPTPPPIPTVLSSENTMEIYPDSSISFAEGETLTVVAAPNTPQENETTDYNNENKGSSRRGLLENVTGRSSDYPPSDEAALTRPSPADQKRKTLESTAIFDPSETSNASVGTNEDEVPRPYGQSRQRRSRCFVFFLIVLTVSTLCGIGFGVAGKKQRPQHQQIASNLETRLDPSLTSWPTSSPSQYIKEASPSTAIPTRNPLSQTTYPSVAPSQILSPTATSSRTTSPSVAPYAIPLPTLPPIREEVSSSNPILAPSPSPTEAITTTLPTIDPIEAAKMLLPDYPDFRYVAWNNVTVSLRLMLQQFLGYNEANWNLPGTINNNGKDYSSFWEAQSFSTIQKTASIEVISAVASIGFGKTQWDCWVNHFQNFTWAELESLSPISITILAGRQSSNTETGNNLLVLGSDIQMAMRTFGWTESNWSTLERMRYFFPTAEEGLGARSPWDDLTVREQAAATRLCFTQELWDRIPLK